MSIPISSAWGLILAGGEGARLRSLTRQISGDPRPKQFCKILDGETLLDRTRRRVDLVSRFDRQVIVVTRAHEAYYRDLLRELAPERLVVQPDSRGTAAGILYPLLRIRHLAGDTPVAIFPSDHYISDDLAFAGYVHAALAVARQRPDLTVLLGIEATNPETEYGWIEPVPVPLPTQGETAFGIRRFWEKPSARLAEWLWSRGALWNSFVMVGQVDAFLRLLWHGVPDLLVAFDPLRRAIGTPQEADVASAVYAAVPVINFSERILASCPDRLATVRVKSVDWSDWGNPQRVLATARRVGWRPSWLDRVHLAAV
jgi:mannose-1-phosphate guanylyltransferase